MEHGRSSSLSSLSASGTPIIKNESSISSGSPMNSPSPTVSPYVSPTDSPSDPSNLQKMSLEPPSQQPPTKSNNNTFVHKLFNTVLDDQYQHLIAWNYTGASFIVCNIVEFSRDVLPKHFKHNNFSSFVRQLNMYGFHKVNKSPRGHRTLAENQIWEFSHPKFMRDRHDLLDEIKRKALESDNMRRDTNDMGSHLSMMQMAQSDMMQQLGRLQEGFDQIIRELAETKQRQNTQQEMMKTMMQFLSERQGVHFQMPPDFDMVKSSIEQPPSILITSPDVGNTTTMDNFYMTLQQQPSSPSSSSSSSPFMQAPVLSSQTNQFHQHTNNSNNSKHHLRRNTPLTVQTQNLSSPMDMNFLSDGRSPTSPYSNYHTPMASTPVSPNAFLSDDDAISPRTPNTISPSQPPNSSESVMMNHLLQQEQQHQQQIDHQQSHHEQQQLLHIQMGQMLANDRFSFRMDG